MPMATDSGTEAAGESRLSRSSSHTATDGGCWMWPPPLLRLLPCLADRSSVRSVCRHWRAAARVQILPPPLPVLVLPGFRFSCLISDELLTDAGRAQKLVEVAGDDVHVAGSSDDWMIAVRPRPIGREVNRETDGDCFLVNAFSGEAVHLPPLSTCQYSFSAESSSALAVQSFSLGTSKRQPCLHLSAVLSASPSSGSKYIVAALSGSSATKFLGLVLWQPGMTSWYLCRSTQIHISGNDLAFYQGKLYMVWKTRPRIFAFELRKDDDGVSLSSPQQYMIDPFIVPYNPNGWVRCNLVVWRGKLLLIIRLVCESYSHKNLVYRPHRVEVFALDFSTNPCGVTQIHNFDGDCIFVQRSGCKSFSTGLHLGVQGDLIYFSDECINNCFPYVYNMRDGSTMRCSDVDLRLAISGSGLPKESCRDFPVWIFPS